MNPSTPIHFAKAKSAKQKPAISSSTDETEDAGTDEGKSSTNDGTSSEDEDGSEE